MKCLYPVDCINKVSHLEKKRNRDEEDVLPDLKKLKINETRLIVRPSEIIIPEVKESNIKIEIKKKTIPLKTDTQLKIELIDQKLKLFKLWSAKYIGHLQDEFDKLKNLID